MCQLDLVAVSNAPISVDLVSMLGPVMRYALLSCRLINEVRSDWTYKNAKTKCTDDDCCKRCLCFDHDAVVLDDCVND